MYNAQQIIDEVIAYSIDFIEKPHLAFGNLPVCPFARKFRLEKRIHYLVLPFSLADPLAPEILDLVTDFTRQHRYDSYFVIHPDQKLNLEALCAFCTRLSLHVKPLGLILFRGHPQDNFQVGNLHTRREPYPGFQLLRESLLLEARSRLDPVYFQHWSPEARREVGLSE